MSPAVQASVYLLCLATSAICALLLVRSYLRNRTQLLLWSALCFVLLALNNLLVVFDILVTEMDLTAYRQAAGLGAVLVLLFGFVWDVD